jgi:DNA-binding beta-propeller fold protein YncE
MKSHTLQAAGIMAVLALTAIQACAQSTYEHYTFTTIAGAGGFESPQQTGTAARINGPTGVAVDSAGNLYVADSGKHAMRKLTQGGEITELTTIAGKSAIEDE